MMADAGVEIGMNKESRSRHLTQAGNYRLLRTQAFQVWQDVVYAS